MSRYIASFNIVKIHIEAFTTMMSHEFFIFISVCAYLIAMGTDPEPTMRNKADQQLVEIDKKYAGFVTLCIFKLCSLNLNIVLW